MDRQFAGGMNLGFVGLGDEFVRRTPLLRRAFFAAAGEGATLDDRLRRCAAEDIVVVMGLKAGLWEGLC